MGPAVGCVCPYPGCITCAMGHRFSQMGKAFISAGWAHNYLLEPSKRTDTKVTFIGVKFGLDSLT